MSRAASLGSLGVGSDVLLETWHKLTFLRYRGQRTVIRELKAVRAVRICVE